MAFCLGRLGLNTSLDFAFFQFRTAVNLFSLGVGLFLIKCNRTVHTLPSSFLFPVIIYHCENDQFQANNVPRKRKNKSKKKPGKAHIKKLHTGNSRMFSLKSYFTSTQSKELRGKLLLTKCRARVKTKEDDDNENLRNRRHR